MMSSKMRRKPSLLLFVVGILTVLLPLLAYLQFQWLGKVSEREREQMQTSLRRTLDQFRQDFDREIARIYFQFQAEPFAPSRSDDEYAKLYAHWSSTAPYPKLIKDILFDSASSGSPDLQRLNLSSGAWGAADRTSEFGPRRFLEPRGPVDGSIPAIIIPLPGLPSFHQEPIHTKEDFFQIGAAQLIVRLDLQYIRNEFIPTLIRSHFGGSASEYRIQVADGEDNSRVIYTTESNAAADGKGDADQDILALRMIEYRNLVPATVPLSRNVIETHARHINAFDVHVVRGMTAGIAFAAENETQTGFWKVTATHRAGSLDAAVGQIRHRNMAVSFGILTILAASVGIVLISAQRAQRLARQQMEFVSAVSHELRTPLAVICSAGENLADGVVRDSEQLKSYGKVVRNEGRRLTEMVEQVLSFAGIQSGLKKYNLIPTDISTVVDRSIAAFEVVLRESGFTVDREISNDGLTVSADAPSLQRALQNLISNAIKYSGSSRWIGIATHKDGDWIRIAVQDRGTGISDSDQPHIFDPFYRGRLAVDGQIQGSGLGLSLVKQIVAEHGGEIDVNSNPGGGSIFSIRLPIMEPSSEVSTS